MNWPLLKIHSGTEILTVLCGNVNCISQSKETSKFNINLVDWKGIIHNVSNISIIQVFIFKNTDSDLISSLEKMVKASEIPYSIIFSPLEWSDKIQNLTELTIFNKLSIIPRIVNSGVPIPMIKNEKMIIENGKMSGNESDSDTSIDLDYDSAQEIDSDVIVGFSESENEENEDEEIEEDSSFISAMMKSVDTLFDNMLAKVAEISDGENEKADGEVEKIYLNLEVPEDISQVLEVKSETTPDDAK